jgi:CRISPR-associated protein Csx14
MRAAGETSPTRRVLQFIDRAEARAAAPAGSQSLDAWNSSWGPAPIAVDRALGYPFPDPPSPATLACHLSDGTHTLSIDHWGDATERDNVKFWAGAGGYPGAALARDALALVRGHAEGAASDPFAFSAPQSSSFRLDWRRDYIPIHAGFSLNAHDDMATLGYPIVELLAAVGLANARPRRPDRRDKLTYEYAVIGRDQPGDRTWLPPQILRIALGAASLPFPMRRFRMLLDWPGKEGQARSITTVTEENIA